MGGGFILVVCEILCVVGTHFIYFINFYLFFVNFILFPFFYSIIKK